MLYSITVWYMQHTITVPILCVFRPLGVICGPEKHILVVFLLFFN